MRPPRLLGPSAHFVVYYLDRHAGALRLLDGDAGPHIIVAPASLLENWQRELARWCPSLKVAPYFGAARIDLRNELDNWRCASALPQVEVFPGGTASCVTATLR